MIKTIFDYYKAHRPDIAKNLEHVAGARRNGDEDGDELQEEYIKGLDSGGTKGATWPDGTIRYANKLAEDTAEE